MPDSVYARLLALRTGLRHFERWSENQARAAGLTPAQHQLLLAIRGHADPRGPTIGEVADYLLLIHNSAVGLVDRAVVAGLVIGTETKTITGLSDCISQKTAPNDWRSFRLSTSKSSSDLPRTSRERGKTWPQSNGLTAFRVRQ